MTAREAGAEDTTAKADVEGNKKKFFLSLLFFFNLLFRYDRDGGRDGGDRGGRGG